MLLSAPTDNIIYVSSSSSSSTDSSAISSSSDEQIIEPSQIEKIEKITEDEESGNEGEMNSKEAALRKELENKEKQLELVLD